MSVGNELRLETVTRREKGLIVLMSQLSENANKIGTQLHRALYLHKLSSGLVYKE
jgi:hypothetical protein